MPNYVRVIKDHTSFIIEQCIMLLCLCSGIDGMKRYIARVYMKPFLLTEPNANTLFQHAFISLQVI